MVPLNCLFAKACWPLMLFLAVKGLCSDAWSWRLRLHDQAPYVWHSFVRDIACGFNLMYLILTSHFQPYSKNLQDIIHYFFPTCPLILLLSSSPLPQRTENLAITADPLLIPANTRRLHITERHTHLLNILLEYIRIHQCVSFVCEHNNVYRVFHLAGRGMNIMISS